MEHDEIIDRILSNMSYGQIKGFAQLYLDATTRKEKTFPAAIKIDSPPLINKDISIVRDIMIDEKLIEIVYEAEYQNGKTVRMLRNGNEAKKIGWEKYKKRKARNKFVEKTIKWTTFIAAILGAAYSIFSYYNK